jgi:predicted peroxiredoxin
MSRNLLVRDFLKTDCTHLLFVDSDQCDIPPDAVETLIAPDVDIVGGLYFKRAYPYPPIMYRFKEEGEFGMAHVVEFPMNALVEVDVIGMGLTLIKREVFNKLKRPYFYYGLDEHEDGSRRGMSEDTYFCRQARRAGIQIFCHTGVVVGHIMDTAVGVDHFADSFGYNEAEDNGQREKLQKALDCLAEAAEVNKEL